MERLQQRRREHRNSQDRWLGRLAEALVILSLLYLLARSPLGQSLVDAIRGFGFTF